MAKKKEEQNPKRLPRTATEQLKECVKLAHSLSYDEKEQLIEAVKRQLERQKAAEILALQERIEYLKKFS
jgi:hypothetical protein